jgi:hypothetical protein
MGPMEAILTEIDRALDAGLYYLAIALSLTLPDICGALESPDGGATRERFTAWYDTYLAQTYQSLTAADCYSLRCGVIHQGRFGDQKGQYSRVIFTVPNPQKNVFHGNILNDAYNLDAVRFCHDLIDAVRTWYVAKKNDPNVAANIPKLVTYRPLGLTPYMVGMPLIA